MKGDFGKTVYLQNSLRLLTEFLFAHYENPAIVLIDEYDVPLDKAYQDGFYQEWYGSSGLYSVRCLRRMKSYILQLFTGCLRIAKESIFTGLNNFKVRTISDVDFAEYFGFTDNEVQDMFILWSGRFFCKNQRVV